MKMSKSSERKNVKGRQIGMKAELGLSLAKPDFKHANHL